MTAAIHEPGMRIHKALYTAYEPPYLSRPFTRALVQSPIVGHYFKNRIRRSRGGMQEPDRILFDHIPHLLPPIGSFTGIGKDINHCFSGFHREQRRMGDRSFKHATVVHRNTEWLRDIPGPSTPTAGCAGAAGPPACRSGE